MIRVPEPARCWFYYSNSIGPPAPNSVRWNCTILFTELNYLLLIIVGNNNFMHKIPGRTPCYWIIEDTQNCAVIGQQQNYQTNRLTGGFIWKGLWYLTLRSFNTNNLPCISSVQTDLIWFGFSIWFQSLPNVSSIQIFTVCWISLYVKSYHTQY